jgi:hypothetical protein
MADLPEDPLPDLRLPPDGDLTREEEVSITRGCLEAGCTCNHLQLGWSRCREPDCTEPPGHISLLVIKHEDDCPLQMIAQKHLARAAEWQKRIQKAQWN